LKTKKKNEYCSEKTFKQLGIFIVFMGIASGLVFTFIGAIATLSLVDGVKTGAPLAMVVSLYGFVVWLFGVIIDEDAITD
jgi:hypothetical protein